MKLLKIFRGGVRKMQVSKIKCIFSRGKFSKYQSLTYTSVTQRSAGIISPKPVHPNKELKEKKSVAWIKTMPYGSYVSTVCAQPVFVRKMYMHKR